MIRTLRTISAAAIILAAGLGNAWAHDYKLGDLEIHHPAARAMMPGADVASGYMTIVNHGAAADKLLKIEAPMAKHTQLHEMKVENDVMNMNELTGGLDIPIGANIDFKKNDLHVMFMGVEKPIRNGDKFNATLTFEKAGPIEVEFFVGDARSGAAAEDMDHKEHKQ
jgi:copper(I)-binding protein